MKAHTFRQMPTYAPAPLVRPACPHFEPTHYQRARDPRARESPENPKEPQRTPESPREPQRDTRTQNPDSTPQTSQVQNPESKYQIRGSIVVNISACHAEDPGSIPGRGGYHHTTTHASLLGPFKSHRSPILELQLDPPSLLPHSPNVLCQPRERNAHTCRQMHPCSCAPRNALLAETSNPHALIECVPIPIGSANAQAE